MAEIILKFLKIAFSSSLKANLFYKIDASKQTKLFEILIPSSLANFVKILQQENSWNAFNLGDIKSKRFKLFFPRNF